MCDGELQGVGDRYKVRFDDLGFELTPMLGSAAPRNVPVSFQLESIGRGGTHAPLRSGTPKWSDLRVEYDRGAAIERYDVGVDAMEQSFVFARRPAGDGDLIVRGRMHTDLVVTATESGLRLELPGVGGLHIGAVTGIDAHGERVTGGLRWADGMLELSLPGEFVDRAALPLVLDPPIGSFFLVSAAAANESTPDAAFDASTDSYLVVWHTVVSASDHDVFAQRVSRTGALIGNQLVIVATSATLDDRPRVANLNGPDTFVVVYQHDNDVHGRWVTAAGAVSTATTIAGSTDRERSPDIGGDATPLGDRAVCVWINETTGSLRSMALVPNFVNRPTLTSVASSSFASGFAASRLHIAKGGGSARRFAIAWDANVGNDETWCMVLDGNGAPLTAATALDVRQSAAGNVSIDGDGSHWVAAWQVNSGLFPTEIAARRIGLTPAGALSTSPLRVVSSGGIVTVPAVLATGGSTLIGWSFQASPVSSLRDVHAASVDPFACAPCEVEFIAGGSQTTNLVAAGCAAVSAGGPGDDALLVWQTGTTGDIAARVWRSADGVVNTLGGGCGNGGLARAPCVRVPNPDFTHRLLGTTPTAPCVLVQSLGQGSVTCGSCTLIPALAGAIALFVLTDAQGSAAVASPIPNNLALRGLVQFEQWLTLRPGAACTQSGVDLSGALRVRIE